jgi:signal transduction histidine kinase
MPAPITLEEALETLKQLEATVPARTGRKLSSIWSLLRQLAQENTELRAMRQAQEMPTIKAIDPVKEAKTRTLPRTEVLMSGIREALRAPLQSIHLQMDLAAEALLLEAEEQAWLEPVRQQSAFGLRLLDTLQLTTNLEDNIVFLEPQTLIASELLTSAWHQQAELARAKQQEVTLEAPPAPIYALGDPTYVRLVLSDLLDNALRYAYPGGQVRVSVESIGSHALFSVVDSGIGLNDDDLKQVGRPFWRGVTHKLVREHSGTGLRLYLARLVLSQMEGELIFSGQPGSGSTFSFTLPLAESHTL